ncbi:hypothetical protein SEPCBS119000_001375 [Sporothrix epigloea]|uniref:BHLH domain-containing protein n=1 Tax=Sporothrix epigloea TaxID=1892477 RepID=A0ABP0DBF4_9PEZI
MEKTPSPTSVAHTLPQPLHSPAPSSMSVASIVSPTSPSSGNLRRLTLDRHQALESTSNTASLTTAVEYDHMARRESVDSRMNQGFGDLRLGGNSPYGTHNHSSTSIHQSFQAQQQRQPRTGPESLSVHRISNGYQPSVERNPDSQNKTVRTAPAITGPAISHIARAPEPTKGQAWAFPEEEIQRMPSAASQSLVDSRRSSIADSLASSQFTTESRLPPGQQRFTDPMSRLSTNEELSEAEYHGSLRMSGTSGEFPTTHHHALQHKQVDNLQAETGSLHTGIQPYSRTPELRISHKLAERKRRTEMKELFEQLRDLMPQERGSKASKWEILTKAITEHQRLQETLRCATMHSNSITNDMAAIKSEIHNLRLENRQLRAQVASLHSNANGANSHAPEGMTDPFSRGPGPARGNDQQLPPLRALSSTLSLSTAQPPPPESMTGVQYDQSRVNGFRPQLDRY